MNNLSNKVFPYTFGNKLGIVQAMVQYVSNLRVIRVTAIQIKHFLYVQIF